MYRTLFKFIVTTLTILTANLLTTYISSLLISHKYEYRPIRFTLVSMGIIVLVFFPLFTKLQEWINHFSKKFVKASHSFAGKNLGLILMFLAGLLILLFFYVRMWYDINLFKLIVSGKFFKAF